MSAPADDSSLRQLNAVLPTREYLSEMWRRRDFVAALPMEQLQAQHQTTLLGNFWHLMNPMLTVLIFYLIFGVMLDVSRGIDNYLMFLMAGVFSFNLTTSSLTNGARSVVTNGPLMRAVRFPRAMLPISTTLSQLMTFGFELAVLVVAAFVTGAGFSTRWFALPIVLLVHTMFNLGGAFIVARLNDSFRDVQELIPFVMRLMTYLAGVMFDIHERAANAPGWVQTIVRWNPMVAILDMYRWVFLGRPVDTGEIFRFLLVASILLVGGFRFFVAHESRYGRG